MYAYAHTHLDAETIKRTSFPLGGELFAFIGGFHGLKGLPNFVHKTNVILLSIRFSPWHTLMMFYSTLTLKNTLNLEFVPQKFFFALLKSNVLDMKMVTIPENPINQKLLPFIKYLRPLDFHWCTQRLNHLNEKLQHINLKPFYDLSHENTSIELGFWKLFLSTLDFLIDKNKNFPS